MQKHFIVFFIFLAGRLILYHLYTQSTQHLNVSEFDRINTILPYEFVAPFHSSSFSFKQFKEFVFRYDLVANDRYIKIQNAQSTKQIPMDMPFHIQFYNYLYSYNSPRLIYLFNSVFDILTGLCLGMLSLSLLNQVNKGRKDLFTMLDPQLDTIVPKNKLLNGNNKLNDTNAHFAYTQITSFPDNSGTDVIRDSLQHTGPIDTFVVPSKIKDLANMTDSTHHASSLQYNKNYINKLDRITVEKKIYGRAHHEYETLSPYCIAFFFIFNPFTVRSLIGLYFMIVFQILQSFLFSLRPLYNVFFVVAIVTSLIPSKSKLCVNQYLGALSLAFTFYIQPYFLNFFLCIPLALAVWCSKQMSQKTNNLKNDLEFFRRVHKKDIVNFIQHGLCPYISLFILSFGTIILFNSLLNNQSWNAWQDYFKDFILITNTDPNFGIYWYPFQTTFYTFRSYTLFIFHILPSIFILLITLKLFKQPLSCVQLTTSIAILLNPETTPLDASIICCIFALDWNKVKKIGSSIFISLLIASIGIYSGGLDMWLHRESGDSIHSHGYLNRSL